MKFEAELFFINATLTIPILTFIYSCRKQYKNDIKLYVILKESHYVAQAYLKIMGQSDPPTLAS